MKVLRVKMSDASAKWEQLDPQERLLGGRGLIARILLREGVAGCEPLGPNNKLIFTIGALAGANVPSSGRLSIGAKSPLTGGIKEANSGGTVGYKMASLGLSAIIIEGQPLNNQLYILELDEDKVQFSDASEFKMLGNYDLVKRLYQKFGKDIGVISIGPAGEYKMAAAGIAITDPEGLPGRFAARGGLGSVMMAKGLKAIVIKAGHDRLKIAHKEKFKEHIKEYAKLISENPTTATAFREYGTAMMVNHTNAMGGLPTRNFKAGQFELADKISGDALYDLIEKRGGKGKRIHACMKGCLICCSNVVPDINGDVLVSPLEYETICLLGSNLGIGNLDEIAKLNWLCNDYGVDTIEVGGTLGMAMDAGLLPFGDFEQAAAQIREIGKGTALGRLLGAGVGTAGKVLGAYRVPAVKGQGLSGYDPRSVKGTGVTFATSPMGADHTAGLTIYLPKDHHDKAGQVEASRKVQIVRAAFDTLGMCIFTMPAIGTRPDLLVGLINSIYNENLSPDYIELLGKQTLLDELAFNDMTGMTRAQDKLPEFFYQEKLPPFGTVFDISAVELEETLKF